MAYISVPRADVVRSVARLGGVVARGIGLALARKRRRDEQTEALTRMANGLPAEDFDSSCGECEERERELEEAARLFGR